MPGFTPSEGSYALAEEALGRLVGAMHDAGVTDGGDVDCLVAMVGGAGVSAGIDYVNKLGLSNIRTHAKQLTDRLQTELPPLGYKALTPRETQTPIVAFELKEAAATQKALQAGKVVGTVIGNENRLRLAVSVFNTHDDIDRVVAVLGGKTTSL